MSDRVRLITGASSGLGRHVAEHTIETDLPGTVPA